jgi:hypothetical protein
VRTLAIKDPIRGWVLVPEWMATMARAERGFGIDHEADRRAFSGIHRGLPPSAKVTPVAPVVTTVGDAKPSGWSDPLPVDRVAKAFEEQDRVDAGLRRKLK